MTSDGSLLVLIEQAWSGDSEAFNRLYQILCRYLMSYTGHRDIVPDLAQETLEKAWNKWPTIRDIPHVQSYLFRIATNHAIDYLRRTNRRSYISLEEMNDHEDAYETGHLYVTRLEELPEYYLEQVEEQRRVRLALAQVPEEYRDCIILFIIEGVSQLEIARILHKNVRTVQRHIARGKEELRRVYLALESEQDIQIERLVQ